MFTEKEFALKGLIESRDGIHLTGYMVNGGGDLIELKRQLSSIISAGHEYLEPVMNFEDRSRFLQPLNQLLHDASLLKQMKGNIGLFRKEGAFRVLSLPVDVEPRCIVATSFHVKPLLKWMQADRSFLLLGLDRTAARLYYGGQQSFQYVGSYVFEGRRPKADEFSAVHEWIQEHCFRGRLRLFVTGQKRLLDAFWADADYKDLRLEKIRTTFEESKLPRILTSVREFQQREAKLRLENAILEFHLADHLNYSRTNLFQIAKAASEGRVRKLIVADKINIFGKLNRQTGEVSIHPFGLDHEDDDLLDDLAQEVLSQGGQVIVAEREEIPKGRPILAILREDERLERDVRKTREELTRERISV